MIQETKYPKTDLTALIIRLFMIQSSGIERWIEKRNFSLLLVY